MTRTKLFIITIFIAVTAASCGSTTRGDNTGNQMPIDSTNVKGTAPATYGGENPAINADSNRNNLHDTGTKANNVHNTGYDSVKR
jgi:hypothetical protein